MDHLADLELKSWVMSAHSGPVVMHTMPTSQPLQMHAVLMSTLLLFPFPIFLFLFLFFLLLVPTHAARDISAVL